MKYLPQKPDPRVIINGIAVRLQDLEPFPYSKYDSAKEDALHINSIRYLDWMWAMTRSLPQTPYIRKLEDLTGLLVSQINEIRANVYAIQNQAAEVVNNPNSVPALVKVLGESNTRNEKLLDSLENHTTNIFEDLAIKHDNDLSNQLAKVRENNEYYLNRSAREDLFNIRFTILAVAALQNYIESAKEASFKLSIEINSALNKLAFALGTN